MSTWLFGFNIIKCAMQLLNHKQWSRYCQQQRQSRQKQCNVTKGALYLIDNTNGGKWKNFLFASNTYL